MALSKKLVLTTILVLTTVLGYVFVSDSGTAESDAVVVAAKVEATQPPVLTTTPWTKQLYPQSRSFTVASACTAACQKKHNACYRDCEIRYIGSTAEDDCKGACDGDKRLCRAACR
jgi:hypothetical protein